MKSWYLLFWRKLTQILLGMYVFIDDIVSYFCMIVSISFNISGSSSSCHADPLSPPVSIVHRSREVVQATPCIGTELLSIGSRWSSKLCSSMWRGLLEYIAYDFVLTSLAASCMSGSSNLDSFRDSLKIFSFAFSSFRAIFYSCCFVGCCLQDLFNITRSILL